MLYLNIEEQAIIERLRKVEQGARPAQCVVCLADIEQGWGGQTRRYCDRAGCRKRGSRLLRMVERDQWEEKTLAEVREYWGKALTQESREQLEGLLESGWITVQADHGAVYHRRVDLAKIVSEVINRERQAAWNQLERYTVILEQRADRSKERVQELEEELHRLRLVLPQELHAEIERQPRYLSTVSADPAATGAGRLDRQRAAALLLLPEAPSQGDDDGKEA